MLKKTGWFILHYILSYFEKSEKNRLKYQPKDQLVPNWVSAHNPLVELSCLRRKGKVEDVPWKLRENYKQYFLKIIWHWSHEDVIPEKTAFVCCCDAAIVEPVQEPGWGRRCHNKSSARQHQLESMWNLGTAGKIVGLRAFISAVRVFRLPE